VRREGEDVKAALKLLRHQTFGVKNYKRCVILYETIMQLIIVGIYVFSPVKYR